MRVLVVALAALAAAGGASPRQESALPPPTLTFFVGSDSHFGAPGMEDANLAMIAHMNALPGTAYPDAIGGRVETPRGVLMTGDLTDNGTLEEFDQFEQFYGRTGKDALLRYPVYEAIGNHDVNETSPIKARQKLRHGGINYAWDLGDLRFFCLDMYADAATLAWLVPQLRKAGPDKPLILFHHYPVLPGNQGWSRAWPDEEKDALGRAIEGSNVIAIFHGHMHAPGHYIWRDRPVFRPGAAKSRQRFFLVVRVGADEMSVATWNFDGGGWGDAWTVPIRRSAGTAGAAAGSR
jgi:3',5'-cyclic AMP phosphodiesterase CpdA